MLFKENPVVNKIASLLDGHENNTRIIAQFSRGSYFASRVFTHSHLKSKTRYVINNLCNKSLLWKQIKLISSHVLSNFILFGCIVKVKHYKYLSSLSKLSKTGFWIINYHFTVHFNFQSFKYLLIYQTAKSLHIGCRF